MTLPETDARIALKPVVVHDGGDTMCDSDDGAVGELGPDRLLHCTN